MTEAWPAFAAAPYVGERRPERGELGATREVTRGDRIFFVLHWQAAVFFQSFFLHRYGAHRQFEMSPRAERVFYFLTWLTQGSSFLSPRGYAILHRLHHAYSDTAKDPHSPHYYRNVFTMMWATKKRYEGFVHRTETPEARFDGGYPEWPAFDAFADSWMSPARVRRRVHRVLRAFATHWWMFLLLPAHYVMGPLHGAIVNWGGHSTATGTSRATTSPATASSSTSSRESSSRTTITGTG